MRLPHTALSAGTPAQRLSSESGPRSISLNGLAGWTQRRTPISPGTWLPRSDASKPAPPADEFLTVQEVAKLLKVAGQTVYNWI